MLLKGGIQREDKLTKLTKSLKKCFVITKVSERRTNRGLSMKKQDIWQCIYTWLTVQIVRQSCNITADQCDQLLNPVAPSWPQLLPLRFCCCLHRVGSILVLLLWTPKDTHWKLSYQIWGLMMDWFACTKDTCLWLHSKINSTSIAQA